jgi:nitroreductase
VKKPAPSYETPEVREVAELIRGRRTIDLYLQTPVPTELVRDAIEAATWAPNHHVTEPWRFWSEKPGWLVVTCERSDDALREREDYGACCAAVQNFLLYLWKLGIGSKWTTGPITRDDRLADIVGFDPEKAFVVGLVWFGYPKVTPQQSRKPLDDVLETLP